MKTGAVLISRAKNRGQRIEILGSCLLDKENNPTCN